MLFSPQPNIYCSTIVNLCSRLRLKDTNEPGNIAHSIKFETELWFFRNMAARKSSTTY